MTTGTIFILIAVLAYLVFTIRYSFALVKSPLFSGGLKTFYLIMIWLIPFIWIFILRALSGTAPGSHEVGKKQPHEPFSDTYTAPTDFY